MCNPGCASYTRGMMPVTRLSMWLILPVFVLLSCAGEQRRQQFTKASATAVIPLASPSATPMGTAFVQTPTPTVTRDPSTPPDVRTVRYAAGVRFDAREGLYFVDPVTGEVQGWEVSPVASYRFKVSAGGRYFLYEERTSQNIISKGIPWLYDTSTGQQRQFPRGYVAASFSPDEQQLIMFDGPTLIVLRPADGTEQRRVVLPSNLGGMVSQLTHWNGAGLASRWSPDSSSLLLVVHGPQPARPSVRGAPVEDIVLRVDIERGTMREVTQGLYPFTAWTPDGSRYFIRTRDALEARDGKDDRLLWRTTAADLGVDADQSILGYPIPSPDGRNVIIAGSLTLQVLNAVSGAERFRVVGAFACGRTWTADSQWMALIGYRQNIPGAYLVSADGREVWRPSASVNDVSPVNPRLAAQHLYGPDGGLKILSLPDGTERQFIPISGQVAWDTNHDPLWLRDGRLVVFAPHLGHGGCGFDVLTPPDLQVQFP